MERSPQAQNLCFSSRLKQESQLQYHSSDMLGFNGAGPLKQNKLPTELCPASSVLCVRSMRISAGSQRVLLFPSPSKRLEHRTNNTETTCFVPGDLNNGTVKLGSPYSAPFTLQAEHLGWCSGQTTGQFLWMPRIPFKNFQKAVSETTL